MAKPRKTEFQLLFQYFYELFSKAEASQVISGKKLIRIRDHIEVCDHLVTDSPQKYLLYGAYASWLACKNIWDSNRPADEDKMSIPDLRLKTGSAKKTEPKESTALVKMPPKKSYSNYQFDANERKFLKSLRIKPDN